MTRLGALLLATGVIAAGCGGDDELGPLDDADAAAVAALVNSELSLEEQHCILSGLVELEIEPAAVVEGDLTADEDGELLAATVECVDDLAGRRKDRQAVGEPFGVGEIDPFLEGPDLGGQGQGGGRRHAHRDRPRFIGILPR